MAGKNKLTLEMKGFEELLENLERAGGDLKEVTTKALIESKKIVNQKLTAATEKEKYPAHGKYSTGKTRESIDKNMTVTWEGAKASIDIGFDFKISGTTSIYLMKGTPKMKPVKEMSEAIYGRTVKKEIKNKQKEIFSEAIKRKVEGG